MISAISAWHGPQSSLVVTWSLIVGQSCLPCGVERGEEGASFASQLRRDREIVLVGLQDTSKHRGQFGREADELAGYW